MHMRARMAFGLFPCCSRSSGDGARRWTPSVFGDAVFARSNKLTAHEYEETTWSARTWLSFVHQQVSVALHRAVAWEIGSALGAPTRAGADPRGAYRPHVVGG